MNKQFDYLVFIGRFQPFHIGHRAVIMRALELAERVIVVIGSADKPRDPKNPWTASERAAMIIGNTFEGYLSRIKVTKVRDQIYNDQKWAADVQNAVTSATLSDGWTDRPPKIGLIGHNKDETSFYLKMFPQWGDVVEHEMNEEVNATDLRTLLFEGKNMKYLESLVPRDVYQMIDRFRNTSDYARLVDEYDIIKKYKQSWEVAPYPATFVTADAVVIQSGHVLLIERKAAPGSGLLALPGGFVNQSERVEAAALRELREETRLKVPEPVLRGSIKQSKVFDAPSRSLRGRTITHAFLIELPAGPLPKVKGSDDARKAMWVPLHEVKSDRMFEDHYDIVQYFIGSI